MPSSAKRIDAESELFSEEETASSTLARVMAQRMILQDCSRRGQDLEKRLEAEGLTYDDLVYEVDYVRPRRSPAAPELDEFALKPAAIPVVSFFTGCGGLDLGFEAAGFAHHAAVEINPVFCETLRLNRPGWRILGPPDLTGDVSDREALAETLSSTLGLKRKFDGVFTGGPPCQPFSIAANQRFSKSGANFKRTGFAHATHGNLLFDFVWMVQRFLPRVFLIENVPGLAGIDGGEQLAKALKLLSNEGYRIAHRVINALNYSVPQQRHRLFIIGARAKGEYKFPKPASIRYSCGPVCERPLPGVANHITRKHSAESILRYMQLDHGERDHLGRVDRLNPNSPSKTIIAGGVAGGGRSHLHPYIPRTLSVRECARLQTFPDSFVFCGPPARQFTQVGNAVPPVLGVQLAAQIRGAFYS